MFDKKQTLKTKGIAILMLVFHHLFYSAQRISSAGITFRFFEESTVVNVATGMRLCVWIFAFLSAYGLSAQYSKIGTPATAGDAARFVWKRWVSLMRPYWTVFVLAFAVSAFLGKNPLSMFGDNLFGFSMGVLGLSDFFGLKMPVAAWWYMCFSQLLLFAVPLLHGLCKKYGILTLVGAFFLLPFVGNGIVSPYGGYYLNYLFVVILGVYCAQNSTLEKIGLKEKGGIPRLLEGITILLVIFLCVKGNMKYSSADTWRATKLLMALASLLVCLFAYKYITWKPLERVLCFLGKYSGYIFLIHAFSYTYFSKLTFWSSNPLLTYLTVFLPSLLLAVVCDKLPALFQKISFKESSVSFSKNDTLLIKGVATILLMAVHLFNRGAAAWTFFAYNPEWMVAGKPLISTLVAGSCGKVCVDLFVILSGYGLNLGMKAKDNGQDSLESNVRYSVVRAVKLLVGFWFVYIVFVPVFSALGKLNLAGTYGTGMKGIGAALVDFVGLQDILFEVLHTGTGNVTWWYMSTVLLLYALFPVLRSLVKGKDRWLWLFAILLINIYAPYASYRQMKTGAFFYVAAFYLGMLMAETGMLNALMKWMQKLQPLKTLGAVLLLVVAFLFTQKHRFWGELLYGFAWLMLCVGLFTGRKGVFSNKYCRKPLEVIGKYSSNIFFTHTFFLFGFSKFSYFPKNPVLIIIWFVAWMTVVSWVVEKIKALVHVDRFEAFLLKRT